MSNNVQNIYGRLKILGQLNLYYATRINTDKIMLSWLPLKLYTDIYNKLAVSMTTEQKD